MDWPKALDRLHLDHDLPLNEDVQPIGRLERDLVVHEVDRHLSLDEQAHLCELVCQSLFVCGLEQILARASDERRSPTQ